MSTLDAPLSFKIGKVHPIVPRIQLEGNTAWNRKLSDLAEALLPIYSFLSAGVDLEKIVRTQIKIKVI